ncbi:MAG TPA: tryptophan synthase subunit alpha [Candidatus Angelobacter sp.]|jgi:tryptophan synthase alpha chain|nr:tryptophan synthase subunit alpha [Candidatus Angelobacter sp.]
MRGKNKLQFDNEVTGSPNPPITGSPDHRISRSSGLLKDKLRPDHPITRSPDHPIPPGLVAYVTCGDPDIKTTREIILAAISAGADVIELGVPFSDPVADGPVIQRASERALKNGTSLQDVLQLAREIRAESQAGLVVFSYLNPVLRMGFERFCAEAEDCGVDGVLLIDLTVEEADDYRRCMEEHRLSTVFLVAPTSPDQRLKRIAQACNGFIYAVSRTGVTGAREELAADARDLVRRIRKYTKLPVAIGFGVSTPEHFAQIGEFADAAVVGSAIVQTIEQNPGRAAQAVAELIRSLRSGNHKSTAPLR